MPNATINLRPSTPVTAVTSPIGTSPVAPASLSNPPSTITSALTDWAGKRLGEYEIERLLGAGGNGQVYLAFHRWLEIPVAIKFMQAWNAQDESVVGRFRREASVGARLNHPNLVRALDGGSTGQVLFLVTEFVDGYSLSEWVKQKGPLPVAEACHIIAETCQGLSYIASQKAVHRDIKPANIMLNRDGQIKILDLGLARINDYSHTMTETGQVMGTIDYMAPEQALNPRGVDFRADIYSLGCTFYYLLTGQAPFASDDQATLAARLMELLEADLRPVHTVRADVPRALSDLISKMLAKSPAERPQSYSEIAKILGAYLPKRPTTVSCSSLPPHNALPPEVSYSWSDKLADDILYGARTLLLYLLVGLGFCQVHPSNRPGVPPRFSYSWRWFKFVAAAGFLVVLLGLLGFDWWLFLGLKQPPNGEIVVW